jgi:hypothetical protein
MEIDHITRKDLQLFKEELLGEIRNLLGKKAVSTQLPEWLKSADVRKILKISPGTLQNLRITGALPFKKIGGTMYYRREDISKMLGDED